ncbi:ATP-binding cassette domain-containing protein [Pelomonas sp. KK5]|uniref:ATP-binding cassette domain-containing protein n=1 Tax=Pelomonas sp. KK5 TaxID=1855730 RepID=UPI00097BEE4F|nr:ATP-binding cassette domain-containing protein [Pelomonas sp. KK5]
MSTSQELIRLEGVSKSFGSVQALRDINLCIGSGEIVALLGDNGAGKSTLIRALSGIHPIDEGRIFIKGRETRIGCAQDAIRNGIETIHQDSSLAPDLSIAHNLFLGREPLRHPWMGVFSPIDRAFLEEQTRALLRQAGISKNLDPHTRIKGLSGGERQSIAIARAMFFSSDLIILDEPTNNLGVEETHAVLRFIREAKAKGHACIYITHSLHHVFEVADRVIIMRRGAIVSDMARADTDLRHTESLITEGVPVAPLAH